MAKLCLGTVQLGMKYGVNNILGQPSKEISYDILDYAFNNGIDIFDTATAYGTAEELLGSYIKDRDLSGKIKVISKLRPNIIENDDGEIYNIIKQEVFLSLKKLNIEKLDGYLLHTPSYIHNEDIVKALVEMKKEGFVDNIGVSIYNIEDGEKAIETGVVDYIQLPYSILDQRGMNTGFLKKAKFNGITIFARSAFLQGLYMMNLDNIPSYLDEIRPYLQKFNNLLEEYNVNIVNALIKYVTENPYIDYLVFGVDTVEQLVEDINVASNESIPSELLEKIRNSFQDIKESIIMPSLWAKK